MVGADGDIVPASTFTIPGKDIMLARAIIRSSITVAGAGWRMWAAVASAAFTAAAVAAPIVAVAAATVVVAAAIAEILFKRKNQRRRIAIRSGAAF